jgi:hypothetical protein
MRIGLIVGFILFMTSWTVAIQIVAEGKSSYTIVVAQSPLPANTRAANELQSHLKEMSGVELAILDDSKPLPDHAILIGSGKHLDAVGVKLDAEKLGNDGFVLKTVGEHLVIAGPGPRGSMYGVSDVLEKLGVRWFTPKVTLVPKKPTIELPALDETQIPAFEYREPYFTEAWNKDWAARNKLIGHTLPLDASTGGNIRYADFVHSFDRLVPPALHKDHPEYFPLIGGKRVSEYAQRCLTNPEVLKITIEGVKAAFKAAPDAVITTVSQNDTAKWCECDECKKLTAQYGGQHSGLYLWFVNQVAEAIEKEMPDKLIDTLAYQFTEAAPTGISPRKNVRVRLCPISNCQGHPYEKDDYPASKAFVDNLKNWHKISGDTMYIWHYTTNFAHYLMPLPDFAEFPADTKLYQRSGVKGVFFQGAYCGPGGSDAELRSWVMSRILWNPEADSGKAVSEWMNGVYGKAAPPMRQWFDLLHQRAADPKVHFTCYAPVPDSLFSGDVLPQGDKFFDEAEKLAAGDATASEYVAKNRLCLRYLKIARKAGGEDVAKFVADCQKFGITHISEAEGLDAWAKKHGVK